MHLINGTILEIIDPICKSAYNMILLKLKHYYIATVSSLIKNIHIE